MTFKAETCRFNLCFYCIVVLTGIYVNKVNIYSPTWFIVVFLRGSQHLNSVNRFACVTEAFCVVTWELTF